MKDADNKNEQRNAEIYALNERPDDSDREYLQSILETTPDGFLAVDAQGRIREVNPTYCRISGYSRTELLTLSIFDIEAIEKPEETGARIRRIMEKGAETFETGHRRKDGSVFDVQMSVSHLDKGGGLFVCFCRDITNRKAAEAALAQSAQRYKLLYERAPIAYQSLDENGRFLEVNPAWLEALGYTDAEVIGKNFGDFLHPDWVDHFRENFPKFKAAGEILGVEFEMVKKDGSSILVSFHGKIGRDSRGRFEKTHCVFQDITGQREAARRLQESEQRFRNLFENSPVAYQSLDSEGRFIDVNTELCNLLGYRSEELLGRSFVELCPEDIRGRFFSAFEKFKQNGETRCELQLIAKDGRKVFVILEGRVQQDVAGDFVRTHCILTNITERKRAEKEIIAQRETLAKIFESAPHIAMLVNREGRITNINHKGIAAAGRPKEEILNSLPGAAFSCLYSFEAQECGKTPGCGDCPIRTKILHTFETGRSVHDMEARILVRRDSEIIPCDLLVSTALLRDEDSDKVLVTIDDITKRKSAQRALHESRERLSQIIDFLPDPTFAIDLEGRVIIWNNAFEEMTGIKTEDALGKGDYEYSLPFYGFRRPILVDAVLRQDDEILQRYASVQKEGDILLAEIEVCLRGEGIRVLSCKARPLYDSTGKIIGAIESIRDVTEIKETREKLKESEALYRSVVENMRDVFYRTDRRGFITMISPSACELYGAPCEEITGMHVDSFLMYPSERRKMLQKLRRDGVVRDYELLLRKKDGSPLYASFTSTCIKDKQGDSVGVEGVIRDITDRKRAEEVSRQVVEELRVSEKRLRRAELVAGIGNFEFRMGNNEVYASEGARLIYGLGAKQWSISEVQKIPLPEYRQMLDTALRELIEHGKAYNVEFKIRRPADGKILDIQTFAAYSAKRGLVYGTVQDITERKQIETSLRESEELFRNIFDHHSAVKLIVDPDTGNIQNANKAAAAYYGWSKEELLRMNMRDIMASPGGKEDQFPCEGDLHCEHHHRLADGAVRDVEVFRSQIVAHGKVLHHAIVHDITERKEAERLLRESEEKYRFLFDTINDAVFVYPLNAGRVPGRFLEVNEAACKMLGYRREELLQIGPADIDASDTLAVLPRMMEKLQQEGYLRWEGVHRSREGLYIPVEISNRLFDFRGITAVLSTARDISAAKRAEEEKEILQSQLTQAQKLESVGRLAGGVAHDFNNMLGVILGHAEMAMEQIDQKDEIFSDLSEIMKAANRSADLTRQLLAFARKQTIAPKVLNLNETVEGMFKMLRRLIGEDIDLAWRPAKSLWPVKVDPGQVDQILANLCVNARDAISGPGMVTIETGTLCFDADYCARHPEFLPGEFVMLGVSDNGCGIDKGSVDKIFDPFYTTKEVGEGTGLGLATVYGIVKQNQGFINVYSEPGQGTTFKIYLPRAEKEAEEKSAALLEKSMRGRETVLVVEDEAPILVLVKSILERYGYEILMAESPTEALGVVQGYPGAIHLVLTDVVMPEMNGKDLRDKLAELRPDVKIIFMSGYTANVIAHHGILDEDIDFLQKPFSVKTLLQKVRDVLDRG